MVAKATVMQFDLFKDAKDPFCGLAAARGASWVFFFAPLAFLFAGPRVGISPIFSAMVVDRLVF